MILARKFRLSLTARIKSLYCNRNDSVRNRRAAWTRVFLLHVHSRSTMATPSMSTSNVGPGQSTSRDSRTQLIHWRFPPPSGLFPSIKVANNAKASPQPTHVNSPLKIRNRAFESVLGSEPNEEASICPSCRRRSLYLVRREKMAHQRRDIVMEKFQSHVWPRIPILQIVVEINRAQTQPG